MFESPPKETSKNAQEIFDQTGRRGCVENFVEDGASDYGFWTMKPGDQELLIKVTKADPSLLDELPFG